MQWGNGDVSKSWLPAISYHHSFLFILPSNVRERERKRTELSYCSWLWPGSGLEITNQWIGIFWLLFHPCLCFSFPNSLVAVVKTSLGAHIPAAGLPGFKLKLCSQVQLPVNVHLTMPQAVTHLLGSLWAMIGDLDWALGSLLPTCTNLPIVDIGWVKQTTKRCFTSVPLHFKQVKSKFLKIKGNLFNLRNE